MSRRLPRSRTYRLLRASPLRVHTLLRKPVRLRQRLAQALLCWHQKVPSEMEVEEAKPSSASRSASRSTGGS